MLDLPLPDDNDSVAEVRPGGSTEPDRTFVEIPKQSWVASNDLAFAVRDRFPVSPGHTLIISRRNVRDWWDATPEEHLAMLALVDDVKADLDREFAPAGYNVGFNSGSAAGQTVFHLHVHVIPRYDGDMPDPSGGVRHVIPEKGSYKNQPEAAALTTATPSTESRLHDAPGRPLLPALRDATSNLAIDTAHLAVSFVMVSGLRVLDPILDALLDREFGQVRLLTTDYLGVTEKDALGQLLKRSQQYGDQIQVRVFQSGNTSFHPKTYILTASSDTHAGLLFVGSANASRSGLVDGHEWTLESREPQAIAAALAQFGQLWDDDRSVPLTQAVIDAYVETPRRLDGRAALTEPATQPVARTEIQVEALDALAMTRADGYGAGLVVMATGLGKTWLAAFDSARPQFRRVLFVAHREEILSQARSVFRQVHPGKSIAWLGSGRDERGADIVLASVQTLTRRINEFGGGEFDYIVIDEFHHASAGSYRRVLTALNPKFQLGITATPQRADNADLLSLCEDNLVFDCGLGAGIDRGALSPFHYVGVPDPVDFRPLPWRSNGFDPAALENAVISQERTQASYREWLARKGQRTLGFAVSVRHSDWLAREFGARGARCVSVHSGPTSAPREQSLQRLRAGELDIVFSVDLFNEGVDVPEIDTVLMLRPTQSPVLFMQQIGRGLRLAEGKEALTIIDFVGNHRSFLLPVRLLAGLETENLSDAQLATAVRSGNFVLPEGCSVDYELEAKTTILSLLPKSLGGTVVDFAKAWTTERGDRPSALQTYRAGRNPAAGGGRDWFELLAEANLLTVDESRVWNRHRLLLADVAKTPMTKSYKMTALRAMLIAGQLQTGASIEELCDVSHQLILRDPRLLADVNVKELGDVATVSAGQWTAYWKRWPLEHLTSGGQFSIEADRFVLTAPPNVEDADTLEAMVAELVDWRLAAYLDRRPDGRIRMKVSHSDGRPILRFDRAKHPELPSGRGIRLDVGGDLVWADFMKIAVNVVRDEPEGPNALPDLMWKWFGPDAGKSGTGFHVEVWQDGGGWHMAPLVHQPHEQHQTLGGVS